LLAVAVGLWASQCLPAQEPARLGLDTSATLGRAAKPSPNQEVANTIAAQLRQCGNLRHYNVQIAFQNGTAELTGTVTDQNQREEALRIVQGVPGVERVADQLKLQAVTQAQGTDVLINGADGPPALTPPPTIAPQPTPVGPPGAGEPMPMFQGSPSAYDLNPPHMPPHAWPTYAPYNNYSRVAYPTLYPYSAWPFIGPIYPFPKVPLGWRKISLEWQDGYWWYGSRSNSHDWWRLRYW
jgi:hypothetical protein